MKSESKNVTVKNVVAKTTENPEGEVTKAFTLISYETADDVLSKCSTPEGLKDLLGDLNYGFGLSQRAKVRQQILDANQGPEKSIEKLAKDFIKIFAGLGITLSMEDAMKQAQGSVETIKANQSAA